MLESVSKRGLGIGYLVGTGISLVVGLFGYFLLTFETLPVALTGTLTALLLSSILPLVGYWLYRGPLPNDSIWRIATWSALGIGISTLVAVGIIAVRIRYPSVSMFPSLLVNNVAGGGVLGVLFGTVSELRKRYEETVKLDQHNAVMHRVLRHDIRNSMTVIIGYAEHISSTTNAADQAIEKVKDSAYEVVHLGNTARNVEAVFRGERGGTVDVVDVVESEVDHLRISYPLASIDVDVPPDVRIAANELFTFVFRNLLETTLARSGTPSNVEVAVTTEDRSKDTFSVRLASDGVGADDWETSVFFEPEETTLEHEDGLEVWLVKWFTDYYGESIKVESNDAAGGSLVIELLAEEIETGDELALLSGGLGAR